MGKGALPGWGTWPWVGRSCRKGDRGRGPGGGSSPGCGLVCEEPGKCLEVQEERVSEGGRNPGEHEGLEAVGRDLTPPPTSPFGGTPHRFGEGSRRWEMLLPEPGEPPRSGGSATASLSGGEGADRPQGGIRGCGEGATLGSRHSICPGEGAEGRSMERHCLLPSLPHNAEARTQSNPFPSVASSH